MAVTQPGFSDQQKEMASIVFKNITTKARATETEFWVW